MTVDCAVKPVLRWAGGKSWLIPKIRELIPIHANSYIEPFVGSAALFLHTIQRKTSFTEFYLSDINKELVETYTTLRDNCESVIKYLHTLDNTAECYYHTRGSIPCSIYEAAARFIYLNRTCFNGLYRVNKHNEFNVPFGNKSYRLLFDYDNIRHFAKFLKRANIAHMDFSQTIDFVSHSSFVFLDPPYTVAHQNNNFVKYNQNLFSWNDQIRLAEFIHSIMLKGAKFIMTNASHVSTEHLFSSLGAVVHIQRHSVIGSKPQYRKEVEEMIVTNLEWR